LARDIWKDTGRGERERERERERGEIWMREVEEERNGRKREEEGVNE